MTKDKKRKAAIREAARASGRRYTAVAREMAAAAPAVFQLGALLAECASLPPVRSDWSDCPPEYAPEAFESKLIGTIVPYGAVLELAGLLSGDGREARLTVESADPEYGAVVTCGRRRFWLLSQGNTWPLCEIPGCSHHPDHPTFTHCDEHLTRCGAIDLVNMAQAWSHDRSETRREDRANAGGSTEADVLVKAALATGWYDVVTEDILQGLFGDPDIFEDMYWDADECSKMRDARDREAARLRAVAEAEVRRLRSESDTCVGVSCFQGLRGWSGTRPVNLCPECAPPGKQPHPLTERLLNMWGLGQ
ncbi:hypothetical protein FNH09_08415 [Streptomyces adustus]|uniref:Uncharacterized protein n=1 Tax=Streptomyces adustus TaxID=1609272 RepID=A0A5N8V7T4_9ACTN|nr:hypothetical protein [Streptomyces adustus]MPY31321.1 hypothetical protein [Streptomyces adustus]